MMGMCCWLAHDFIRYASGVYKSYYDTIVS